MTTLVAYVSAYHNIYMFSYLEKSSVWNYILVAEPSLEQTFHNMFSSVASEHKICTWLFNIYVFVTMSYTEDSTASSPDVVGRRPDGADLLGYLNTTLFINSTSNKAIILFDICFEVNLEIFARHIVPP